MNIAMVWKDVDTSILIELNSPFHFQLFSRYPCHSIHLYQIISFISFPFLTITNQLSSTPNCEMEIELWSQFSENADNDAVFRLVELIVDKLDEGVFGI